MSWLGLDKTIRRLSELGVTFNSELKQSVEKMVNKAADLTSLSSNEVDVLKPIIVLKASDQALLKKRTYVKKADVHAAYYLCPFIICFQSFVLKNPRVTAVIQRPAEAELLRKIGIRTNKELANTSVEILIDKLANEVKKSPARLSISPQVTDLMSKRATIWKYQADILSKNYSGSYPSYNTRNRPTNYGTYNNTI